MTTNPRAEAINVSIIGGGIIGLVLAAGLLRRGIQVKVYEQARGFREIGAGIAFTANAIRCMALIDPDIVTALRSGGSVATSSGANDDPNDYLRWIDGYNQRDKEEPRYQKLLYKIDAGYHGFEGCRRDQFLEALSSFIPTGVIEFQKRLDSLDTLVDGNKICMTFCDGTIAEADAVIGCDGIKSRVRQFVVGKGHPACHPNYTHKVAYRALIPMEKAIDALGEYKARNQHNHVGPNAHLIHYPVTQKMINATAFVTDPLGWAEDKPMVLPARREDLEEVFADWNPCVQNVIKLFPRQLEKWAVFDLWDYPAPRYNKNTICLAGDAAHASSPHHGAGACIGIEDALCLCVLISRVHKSVSQDAVLKEKALTAAFAAFDGVRRTRSQWLVNSSRRVCDLYHQPEWAVEAKWDKAETCFEEIKDRSFKIWHFDYQEMITESDGAYDTKLDNIISLVTSSK
ncbi:FAD/NAD(P)-binding domain-containing protein [Xylaria scruposa]|nr:FAD/NAD(P)-binding domain-containing protein [Xylaria scruposa]